MSAALQPEIVLLESLRRLQLMMVSLETLTATDMIVVLSGLQNHPSKQISHLAQILIEDWRLLSPEWTNFSTTFQENIQDVAHHLSPVNDENLLSCPPLDVEFLTFTPNSPFDLSRFFDDVDDDGNPRNTSSEFEKNERQDQIEENSLEDGEISPDWPLPQAFHEEATISNPRNTGSAFVKNESQDQIDENDLEDGEISPDWPLPQAFHEEATISNPRNMGSAFVKNESQDQIDENDLEGGEISPDWPLPQAFHEEATISNPRNTVSEFEKNESQDQIDENDLEDGEISPDWPLPQAFHEEATISNPRNTGSKFEKNERQDQIDENDLEDGELSPDWLLPQAFHEEATISSKTQRIQEPVAAPPTYLQDVPKTCKELSYDIMAEKIKRMAQMVTINFGRKENGEMMMMMHEQDIMPPQSMQAFNQEASVGSNDQKMQKHFEISQSKKLSHQEKIVKNTRKTNASSMEPMRIKNVEMRVHEAGILSLKPAKVAVRTAMPPDASRQVPVRSLLQEKAKGNDNSQKRQEHYVGPSKPSHVMLDVFKQFKESSSQVQLEKNERKAQPRRINAERKEDGTMIIHEENKPLKPTKARQMLQQPNGSPSKPFKANIDGNTLKRKELIEVPSRTSQHLHDVPKQSNESTYQHKMNITKRKIQESYQHLDKVKKQRSIQVLEVKELRMFGIRRTH